ncbi:hypothetical protein [Mycetocola sp.]|uniref:hypothetical protein n=1 Tax=Mycetocola sp. TaxID=1871042 RepID=UPI0039893486
MGKTVLLKHFEEVTKGELNWAACRLQLEPRHNRDDAIVGLLSSALESVRAEISRMQKLKQRAENIVESVRSLASVTIEDVTVSFGGTMDSQTVNLASEILETTRIALSAGKPGLIIMLDEAQVLVDEKDRDGQHPLSLLVAAVNRLQEQQVPVALVLCGLPTLKANLLKARTYSERMFRGEEVGRLSREETREAFLRPLEGTGKTASDELVRDVIEDVEGYPYFVQLWGAELWEEAESVEFETLSPELLEGLRGVIFKRLDHDFYDTRIDSLTPAEQDLLLLTAECDYPPLRTSDIHKVTSRKQGNVNVLMGRLAEQGVVYRTQKGLYEYTAPKFHEYLIRRKQRDDWK